LPNRVIYRNPVIETFARSVCFELSGSISAYQRVSHCVNSFPVPQAVSRVSKIDVSDLRKCRRYGIDSDTFYAIWVYEILLEPRLATARSF